MRYFVRYLAAADAVGGQLQPLFVVRVDDRDWVQVYSVAGPGWVDAPVQGIVADVVAERDWVSLAEGEVEAMLARLQVGPGYWLTVTSSDDEPKLLVRSLDGRTLEGYAVSAARWAPMGYPPNPALNDPALWQPVAAEDVSQVQGLLHVLWDRHEAAAFDAKAPELVDTELTEVAVREGIVHYIIDILKHLPDGLVVGFQPPSGGSIGSCGSGPMGPRGSWNFQVGYRVWGFPDGTNHEIFDAFKGLFGGWGWTYHYDTNERGRRSVDARTGSDRKHSFDVTVSTYAHGGVSMSWTSPYYPAEFADRESTGMRMPSMITKAGIQSWKPPVYPGQRAEQFDDTYFSKEDRYSLGVESTSGRFYASIPVSNGIVDYEEYYELAPGQYRLFMENPSAAIEFIEACRRHDHDRLLLQKPGSNRGTPV